LEQKRKEAHSKKPSGPHQDLQNFSLPQEVKSPFLEREKVLR